MKVVRGISYVIAMLSGMLSLLLGAFFVMAALSVLSGDTDYATYAIAVVCLGVGSSASCVSVAASILPAFSRIPFIKVTSIINLVIQLLMLIYLTIDFST